MSLRSDPKNITLNRNGVKVEESYPKQIYLEDLVVGEYKNVLILNRGWKENTLVDVFAGLAIKALARKKSSCLLPNHQLAIPALIPACPLIIQVRDMFSSNFTKGSLVGGFKLTHELKYEKVKLDHFPSNISKHTKLCPNT